MRTVDDIRADIAALMPEWTEGAALFEPAGVMGLTMFDVQRKVLLAQNGAKVLAESEKLGQKTPTEKIFETLTHSMKNYVEFSEKMFTARKKYLADNARMEQLRAELTLAQVRGESQSLSLV